MIHRTDPALQAVSWQQQLADGFATPGELVKYLGLDPALIPAAERASESFKLRLPRWFADRMVRNDADDPLLRQFLPTGAELRVHPGFDTDPVSDLQQSPVPGLLHKYRGRALLITTGACAVNCRYCFRRHYPYREGVAGNENRRGVLDYLARHADIHEVILSGGDPLVLSDARIAGLVGELAQLPHIRRLRLHTRVPVILPQRITADLLSGLLPDRFAVTCVLHANHPRELSEELSKQLRNLCRGRITLLNQSVLLKGVNDCADTLSGLSEKLFSMGVLPYYLHQLDRVAGAAHFEVSDARALELHAALRAGLPGYLVPRLVREIAGREAKTELLEEA